MKLESMTYLKKKTETVNERKLMADILNKSILKMFKEVKEDMEKVKK